MHSFWVISIWIYIIRFSSPCRYLIICGLLLYQNYVMSLQKIVTSLSKAIYLERKNAVKWVTSICSVSLMKSEVRKNWSIKVHFWMGNSILSKRKLESKLNFWWFLNISKISKPNHFPKYLEVSSLRKSKLANFLIF